MLHPILFPLLALSSGPEITLPSAEMRAGQEDPTERPPAVAWMGSWEQAKAEAARTKRPIMIMSAAPHCRAVPGKW
ncbi:MAG TPA: hypothetical protein EYQ74_01915 [Planctomycetes bacterium]|nr:hypothetical protein [Planctomycetota bacterium]HIK61468.1 hypothetical protein [Planctomycetota bacterium]